MPTAHMYSYALIDKVIRRGRQTLRNSHDIRPIDPVTVGHERQLLMDRHIVDDVNGCYRTVHQPEKHADNPIVKAEESYEVGGPLGCFVLRNPDTGLFQMWARQEDQELRQREGPPVPHYRRVHYYESDDGLDWRRPNLGLFEIDGDNAQNNVCIKPSCNGGISVLRLPERMHDRGRYAGLYSAVDIDGIGNEARDWNHKRLAFSEDGIHWNDAEENPIFVGRTGAELFYHPDRDLFFCYGRAPINAGENRRVAYLQSTDLVSWTQPVNIFGHDELDPLWHYNMPVAYYHGVCLGLLSVMDRHPHDQRLPKGNEYLAEAELAWSRDGENWDRHPKRPIFLPTSPAVQGAIDWGMVYPTSIIEMDDHVRVYYFAEPMLHIPGAGSNVASAYSSYMCLATLRRDGFVSIDAGEDGGYMLTRPMACPGGKLHINARTTGDGFIRVAVREGKGVRDGEWHEAWRFEQSNPFDGDSLDHVMTWSDHDRLNDFPDNTLRLHFWLENAELYSFWFD